MKISTIINRTIMILLITALVLSSAGCSCTGKGAGEETTSQTEETKETETSDETAEEKEPTAVYETKDKTATYELDADKTLILDKETSVELYQTNKEMVIKLIEGEILLDVRKKLEEEESLIIRTSGMDVNVRGTILLVSNRPVERMAGIRLTQLIVLEGATTASYQQTNGTPQMAVVNAGQIATLTDENGFAQTNAQIVLLTGGDISNFARNQITNDEDLLNRLNGSIDYPDENPFPADGQWTWDETVTLVAQSASKMYDGTPLTRTGDVLVYGLTSDFKIQVYASGSQTDAGTGKNEISQYTIYNQIGEIVTSHFTNIQTVDGSLVVEKAPLTVWTASSTKEYDGTALTNKNAGFRTTANYDKDGPGWQNTAISLQAAEGTQVLYGLCGETFVHGMNPVTGQKVDIYLKAGQRLTILLNPAGGNESLQFKIDDLLEKDLPEEVLRIYALNPELLTKACEETNWDIEDILQAIELLSESDELIQTNNGLSVERSLDSKLLFDSSFAYLTIDTDITTDHTTALGPDEVRFRPVSLDNSITITATGSQTEIGTSNNTYTINWGTAKKENYDITENLGTLTVTQRTARTVSSEVLFTAGSGSKVFDGTPLSVSDVTVTGLPEGFTWTANCSGSQTDVGSSANTVTEYHILNESGSDVTKYFTNVKTATGTLTVEPLKVEVSWSQEQKRYYNGETCGKEAGEFTLTYLNGEHAGETGEATVSITVNGNEYLFYLFTGDQISAVGNGSGKDAGTYGIIVSASVAKGTADNYVITTSNGSLVISPVPLIVVTDSASKEKDGQALTAGLTVYNTASGSRVKVSEESGKVAVVAGEILTFTATGSQTNEGESKNTYSVAWGSANEENYTLTDELGTLNVSNTTPGGDDPEKPITIAITITADSANKAYDGTPLTANGSSATGLPEGYMYSATCSGSQITAGTGSNTITRYKIFDASDKDVTEFLTNVTIVDGALTVTPANLTVVTSSASKVYDGTPLTCSTATISGLANGETASVTTIGTITDVGVVTNTYKINWGTVDAANYTVSENLGTLTIEKLQMQVQWSIDKPLTYAGFTLGASHGNAPILTYVNGAHGGETLVGVYLEDESGSGTAASNHSFELFTGDKMAALFSGGGIDVGTYSITGSGKMLSGKASNYQISYSGGSLEIIPVELIIKTESASRGCDGTTLTAGFTVSRIPDEGGEPYVLLSQNGEINFGNDTLAFAVTGSQAGMGSSTNTYSINWNGAKQSNYSITEELGTLTIEKVKVTAQWQPDKDPFDMDWEFHSAANGSMVLTFDNIEQDSIICEDSELLDPDEEDEESKIWIFKFALPALPNLPEGAELSISASGGGEYTGTYTITTAVCDPFAGNQYYEISCPNGSLEIRPEPGCTIRITTGSTFISSNEWDGTPLTNSNVTITILNGNGVEVDEGQSSVKAEAIGSLDHVGKTENKYSITSWGEVNPDDYTIEENLGYLIIGDTVTEAYGGILSPDHTLMGISYDPNIPIDDQLVYKVLDFNSVEEYILKNFFLSPETMAKKLVAAGLITHL